MPGRDFYRQKEGLLSVPASEYVPAITGRDLFAGKMRCPLPGHDERTPSFAVRAERWRCFGCGASGDIYELAALVWEVPCEGRGFREIHERLLGVIDG